jgi:hypothetical protein
MSSKTGRDHKRPRAPENRHSVTPYVSNQWGYINHMCKSPNEFNGIQNQNLKILYSVDRLTQSVIFEDLLDQIRPYSQKIICSSWLVPQVYKSTKNIEVSKYLFQGSKDSYFNSVSRQNLSRIRLAISHLSNSISSWILRFSMCMPTRS